MRKKETKRKPAKRKGARKREAAKKLDLYAQHKDEYVARKEPAFVRIGPARYLGITGKSKPGAEEFNRAVGALYNVAFTVKMARKFAGKDYVVTKLEGLWWLDDANVDITATTTWNWQLLLRVPPFITESEVHDTIESLVKKGTDEEVRRVQLLDLRENECVQVLHIGPYTEEQESIARMRDFAAKGGCRFAGKHHEIYLSDPRRVKPQQLRTILRYPVSS
jgi:hypothetical protein